MNAKKIVALLVVMPVGVFSTTDPCATGWKLKATLTNLKCTSATKSATACKTCCDDKTKCGSNTVACAAGKYQDPAKAGMAGVNDAAGKTACCSNMATCADVTCAAGMKPKTSAATTKCTSNKASCAQSTCCEKDTAKCGGNTITCAAGKYQDPAKAGVAGANDAAGKTACCTDMATCAEATCAAGMKKKTSAATTKCTSNKASCSQSTCCEDDGMATCAAFAPPKATSGAQKMVMNLFLAAVGVALWK